MPSFRFQLTTVAFSIVTGVSLSFMASVKATETRTTISNLKYLPADYENFLWIGDPLPTLQRGLDSDGIRPLRDKLDLLKLLATLEDHTSYVPDEVIVAFPSVAYETVTDTMDLALTAWLCAGASSASDGVEPEKVDDLHGALVICARKLRMPPLLAWIRFRNEQTAQAAFSLVGNFAQSVSGQHRGRLEVDNQSFHYEIELGELLPKDYLASVIVHFGIAETEDEGYVVQASEAIASIKGEIWVERIDNGLRFSVGRPPQELPLRADAGIAIGMPKCIPDQPPLAFSQWRLDSMKAGARSIEEKWQRYRDTEIGKATTRLDTEDSLGDFQQWFAQVGRASTSGSLCVTVDDSVSVVLEERGIQLAQSLGESPILALIPSDIEIVTVDARTSLADRARNALTRFENRLARNEILGDATKYSQRQNVTKAISEFYYNELSDARGLVRTDLDALFTPPNAIFVSSAGRIGRIEVQLQINGSANRVVVENAPIGSVAAIGRCVDKASLLAFADALTRSVSESFAHKLPEMKLDSRDFGLGLKTYTLEALPPSKRESVVAFAGNGDFRPHFFFIEDWFVASTSIDLSRSILRSWRDPRNRKPLPSSGGKLTAFGMISSDEGVAAFKALIDVLTDVARGEGSVSYHGPKIGLLRSRQQTSAAEVEALFDLIRLIDSVSWRTIDMEDVRETRATVSFK